MGKGKSGGGQGDHRAAHGAARRRWLTDDDVSRPARRAWEGGGALELMPILTLTLFQSYTYTQPSTDTEFNLVPSLTCCREPFALLEQQLFTAGHNKQSDTDTDLVLAIACFREPFVSEQRLLAAVRNEQAAEVSNPNPLPVIMAPTLT